MAEAVYALCAVVSLACAVLLQRGYSSSRVRLLLWAAATFWVLALNNLLLFLDLVVFTEVDLRTWRGLSAAAAPLVFLLGLIWDEQK